jgi:hypothetical protein
MGLTFLLMLLNLAILDKIGDVAGCYILFCKSGCPFCRFINGERNGQIALCDVWAICFEVARYGQAQYVPSFRSIPLEE